MADFHHPWRLTAVVVVFGLDPWLVCCHHLIVLIFIVKCVVVVSGRLLHDHPWKFVIVGVVSCCFHWICCCCCCCCFCAQDLIWAQFLLHSAI